MAVTFMSSMGIAMTLLMITMVITVIISMIFRVIAMIIAMVISMVFRVIAVFIAMVIAMAAMTSLLNMHATIKMLCFPPHQGGTDLCFDRETSLIG